MGEKDQKESKRIEQPSKSGSPKERPSVGVPSSTPRTPEQKVDSMLGELLQLDSEIKDENLRWKKIQGQILSVKRDDERETLSKQVDAIKRFHNFRVSVFRGIDAAESSIEGEVLPVLKKSGGVTPEDIGVILGYRDVAGKFGELETYSVRKETARQEKNIRKARINNIQSYIDKDAGDTVVLEAEKKALEVEQKQFSEYEEKYGDAYYQLKKSSPDGMLAAELRSLTGREAQVSTHFSLGDFQLKKLYHETTKYFSGTDANNPNRQMLIEKTNNSLVDHGDLHLLNYWELPNTEDFWRKNAEANKLQVALEVKKDPQKDETVTVKADVIYDSLKQKFFLHDPETKEFLTYDQKEKTVTSSRDEDNPVKVTDLIGNIDWKKTSYYEKLPAMGIYYDKLVKAEKTWTAITDILRRPEDPKSYEPVAKVFEHLDYDSKKQGQEIYYWYSQLDKRLLPLYNGSMRNGELRNSVNEAIDSGFGYTFFKDAYDWDFRRAAYAGKSPSIEKIANVLLRIHDEETLVKFFKSNEAQKWLFHLAQGNEPTESDRRVFEDRFFYNKNPLYGRNIDYNYAWFQDQVILHPLRVKTDFYQSKNMYEAYEKLEKEIYSLKFQFGETSGANPERLAGKKIVKHDLLLRFAVDGFLRTKYQDGKLTGLANSIPLFAYTDAMMKFYDLLFSWQIENPRMKNIRLTVKDGSATRELRGENLALTPDNIRDAIEYLEATKVLRPEDQAPLLKGQFDLDNWKGSLWTLKEWILEKPDGVEKWEREHIDTMQQKLARFLLPDINFRDWFFATSAAAYAGSLYGTTWAGLAGFGIYSVASKIFAAIPGIGAGKSPGRRMSDLVGTRMFATGKIFGAEVPVVSSIMRKLHVRSSEYDQSTERLTSLIDGFYKSY